MKTFRSTAIATTTAAAIAMMGAAAGAQSLEADVDASATAGGAHVQGDAGVHSDALESTRDLTGAVGEFGKDVARGTADVVKDAASATAEAGGEVADAVGQVGANILFDIETAIEAGTTEVTTLDGTVAGDVTGVRVSEAGDQWAVVTLDESFAAGTDTVTLMPGALVKGDGEIVLRMSDAQFRAAVSEAVALRGGSG